MTITIQLGPELYDHIRTLVHDELSEQKNRQKFEQLATKIRAQLEELSEPKEVHNWSEADLTQSQTTKYDSIFP